MGIFTAHCREDGQVPWAWCWGHSSGEAVVLPAWEGLKHGDLLLARVACYYSISLLLIPVTVKCQIISERPNEFLPRPALQLRPD